MKHYLVTGGCGFVGSYLVRALLDRGHRVTALDNLVRGRSSRLDDVRDCERLTFAEVDILDAAQVDAAMAGVDCVYHLAAVNGTGNFYTHAELVLDVGVRGMLHVVDACRTHDVRELVVASSAEAYQSPPEVPTAEDVPLSVPDPLNPRYSYGGSKIVSELIAFNYARDFFDKVQVFRPHNIYGPDMGWKHVIPQFIMRALDAADEAPEGPLPFVIQGDGSETRAFCYIDDLIEGLILMQEKGGHRQIYHIGNMEEVTIADLATRTVRALGREIEISRGERLHGSTTRRCPDIAKIEALGYRAQVPLDEGLARSVDWYRAHRHVVVDNPLL